MLLEKLQELFFNILNIELQFAYLLVLVYLDLDHFRPNINVNIYNI